MSVRLAGMAGALLVVALTGCGPKMTLQTTPRLGQDMETWKKDNYRCYQESETSWSGGGAGLAGIGFALGARAEAQNTAKKKYGPCMEAAGWTVREVPKK